MSLRLLISSNKVTLCRPRRRALGASPFTLSSVAPGERVSLELGLL